LCHRKRRAQLVNDYIASLPANVDRAALLKSLEKELNDLRIVL
jgi:hypothetical protein